MVYKKQDKYTKLVKHW